MKMWLTLRFVVRGITITLPGWSTSSFQGTGKYNFFMTGDSHSLYTFDGISESLRDSYSRLHLYSRSGLASTKTCSFDRFRLLPDYEPRAMGHRKLQSLYP